MTDQFLKQFIKDSTGKIIQVGVLSTNTRTTDISNFSLSSGNADTYFATLQSKVYSYSLNSAVSGNYIDITAPGRGYSRYSFGSSFHPNGYMSYYKKLAGEFWRYYANKPKVLEVRKVFSSSSSSGRIERYSYVSVDGISVVSSSHSQMEYDDWPIARNISPATTVITSYRLVSGSETAIERNTFSYSHDATRQYQGVGMEQSEYYGNGGWTFKGKVTRSFDAASTRVLGESVYQYDNNDRNSFEVLFDQWGELGPLSCTGEIVIPSMIFNITNMQDTLWHRH